VRGRIYGTETEYGCLVERRDLAPDATPDLFALLARDYLFQQQRAGILDAHYRDWGEPPGNGGFLFNGGRLYIDMGHLEYATPECASLWDIVAYERAGDHMLLRALDELGLRRTVQFVRNNVDHITGATFGHHENYLIRRDVSFYKVVIPALLPFLVTRQIYAGSGRVGYHDETMYGDAVRVVRRQPRRETEAVPFQVSQRADHIVTEAYQWIQFSRAIVNTRDEPLGDGNRYRRVHLLVGDANMSDYANALKLGTTALVLTLLEEGRSPPPLPLADPIRTLRTISRDSSMRWLVPLQSGRTMSAIEVQGVYYALAERYLRGVSTEFDWVLDEWRGTLDALATDPMSLNDRLDWVAKRWLLETFVAAEGLTWDDPWLQSIDLEYHKIDPETGLYHDLVAQGLMRTVIASRAVEQAIGHPPPDTRAAGRAMAMRRLAQNSVHCHVDWDGIYLEGDHYLDMKDPFDTYESTARDLGKMLARRKRPGRRPRKRAAPRRQ
jgi:proteasome accessory factor A